MLSPPEGRWHIHLKKFQRVFSRIPKGKGDELPPAVVMKLDVEGKVGLIILMTLEFGHKE